MDRCESNILLSIIFRKWTFSIVQSLGHDTKRYSELHRSLPEDVYINATKEVESSIARLKKERYSIYR